MAQGFIGQIGIGDTDARDAFQENLIAVFTSQQFRNSIATACHDLANVNVDQQLQGLVTADDCGQRALHQPGTISDITGTLANVNVDQQPEGLVTADDCGQRGLHQPGTISGPSGTTLAAYIGTMDNSMELFRHLYAIGFTPPVISRMFDLNCRSLKYQFKKMSIEAGEERVILNDEELDSEVASIVQKFPRIGHKLLKGLHFNSFGKGPFRARLRASLDRVRVERNIPPPLCAVKRRKYSVKAPLSMVHIDGHHKLIRWGMVVHGGICGYSRVILFLGLSNNNRAETVRLHFVKGAREYGMPVAVRVDLGMENTSVADFMLAARDQVVDRPVITGRSVHNQRIERLWRDVFSSVLEPYYTTFREMEAMGLLNPSSDSDIFCLQHVAFPMLSKTVEEFRSGWNHHIVSTEGMTPMQLFWSGLLRLRSEGGHHLEFTNQSQADFEFAENEARLLQEFTAAGRRRNAVHVRPTRSPLTPEETAVLESSFDANSVTLENLIDNFHSVKSWTEECRRVASL